MARVISGALKPQPRSADWVWQAVMVVSASLFVAFCARIALPLPFTPVPLTLQNFGVLLVGLLLGSWRGLAALALYVLEGAVGLPVFSPAGPGGIAQLLGPTGGYLFAYPLVAGLAGWIFERGNRSFARAAVGALLADVLLFIGGLSWLLVLTHSLQTALHYGLYWFMFAEVIKVMAAAGIAAGWTRRFKSEP
jgi:biotin transport system substrate-specific component